MLEVLGILLIAFDFVFDFWFILFLSPLQSKKNGLRDILFSWSFWAFIRVILFFSPYSTKSLTIPEPLNSILFLITGLLLFAFYYWKKYRNSRIIRIKATRMAVKDLLELSPGEFEEMTAELYRALGYESKKIGSVGDHGVDVLVKNKSGKKMVVQCKRWRKQVGEPIIREFYGTVQHEKAVHGTIFALSGFTPQAIEWATGKPLSLYDGKKFLEMWNKSNISEIPSDQNFD